MIKILMQNGEELELGLTMKGLRVLNQDKKYKKHAMSYFEAVSGNKVADSEEAFFRVPDILYDGYLCTLIKNDRLQDAMDFETFEDNLPEDLNQMILTSAALINPNQIGALERHLKGRPGRPAEPEKE